MEFSRTLEIKRVSVDRLHLDPANARTHPETNLEAITASLQRFEQVEPLVIQKGTGRVIAGNGRLVAMRKLGWTECDIVEVEVDDLQATALGIALNRTGELAEWDEPVLAKLLDELRNAGAIDGVGYSADELDDLLAELADANMGEYGEDQAPAPLDDAVSARGDIWSLGDHRLMCGDSASRADLERLLSGAKIQLVNTDPPYNVKVEPRSNNAIAAGLSSFAPSTHHQRFDAARNPGSTKPTGKMRPKDRPLQNDFLPDDEFERLLLAWFGNLAFAHPGVRFVTKSDCGLGQMRLPAPRILHQLHRFVTEIGGLKTPARGPRSRNPRFSLELRAPTTLGTHRPASLPVKYPSRGSAGTDPARAA